MILTNDINCIKGACLKWGELGLKHSSVFEDISYLGKLFNFWQLAESDKRQLYV
jgi:hypothetical protein